MLQGDYGVQTFTITREFRDDLLKRRGMVHPFERLNASRTAFLVVDMQKYFLCDGGPASCPAARDIVPNINRLASDLRTRGGVVVWIQTEATPLTPIDWANFYETYATEARERRQADLARAGRGFPLWPELEIDARDRTVIKTRFSAFIQGASDLHDFLTSRDIDTLLVGGTVTNICCESTARDAMMLGYRTVMIADCNAAATQENHQACLQNFLATFGDVQTTDQAISNLSADSGRGEIAGNTTQTSGGRTLASGGTSMQSCESEMFLDEVLYSPWPGIVVANQTDLEHLNWRQPVFRLLMLAAAILAAAGCFTFYWQ